MTDDVLAIYFNALERLEKRNPIRVHSSSKITLKSVALEAGKSAGAIKKSRTIYHGLIVKIETVANTARKSKTKSEARLEKHIVEIDKYKQLYKESLAREVVLSAQLMNSLAENK